MAPVNCTIPNASFSGVSFAQDAAFWAHPLVMPALTNPHFRPGRLQQCLLQDAKIWGWSKIIDILAWLSCGYGVRPAYAVAWLLLTVLCFGLVFWWGDGIRRSSRPLSGPAEEDSLPERATLRNALFFSTMVFLSQGLIDIPPVGRHRYYVILEGIAGGLLLGSLPGHPGPGHDPLIRQ
ncbi:MAG: hypothetical protein ACP5PV_13280 [Methanothrix sp.]